MGYCDEIGEECNSNLSCEECLGMLDIKIKYPESFVKHLSDKELVQLCNELYDKENGNGDFDRESYLYKLVTNIDVNTFGKYDLLVSLIKSEAHKRYNKVTKLLLCDNPHRFIR